MVLKTAAFGAVFLVSNADPGLFSMIKESFAASDAIARTSGLVKDVLTTGPLPELPFASPLELESMVLPALRRSVEILRDKAPEEVPTYRSVVLDAANHVAEAHRGVQPAEANILTKIAAALADSI